MPDTLSVTYARDTLTQSGTAASILSQGIVGPPGPAGLPGASATVPWHEYAFAVSGDQTVFTLGAVPVAGTVSLYMNGLRQTSDNFTVAGPVLTVTGFTPTTGDMVLVVYQ